MQYGYVVYYRTDYSDCPDDAVAIALSGNSVRQVVENHFLRIELPNHFALNPI